MAVTDYLLSANTINSLRVIYTENDTDDKITCADLHCHRLWDHVVMRMPDLVGRGRVSLGSVASHKAGAPTHTTIQWAEKISQVCNFREKR